MIDGHFEKVMENMKGLAGGPVLLLAVSGGIDSMCMADLFYRTYGAGSIALAHCNFRLRGEESDGDEALVRGWAGERGIIFHNISFDTSGYAAGHGISIEMAARELRYSWFASLCTEHGYAAVAVAHNANDNAETLLLNLVRGTGLRGISGMSAVSPLPYADGTGLQVLRPLLGFTRKQIEGHVFAHKVPYRNDSTNAMSEYKRNSIRNEVFPLLEKLNPSFVKAFNREMTYFSDADEIVSRWCSEAASSVVSDSGDGISINIARLMSYGQWRYLLYHILEPYGFNSSVLASLEDLLLSGRTVSGKSFMSASHVLRTGRGVISVSPAGVEEAGPVQGASLTIDAPGEYCFNGVRFTVEVFARPDGFVLKQPSGTLVMDADRLSFPFTFRRWMCGDWIRPIGLRGRKKLSDLFADLRLDAAAKDRAVVILEGLSGTDEKKHVAGVLGMRTDDMYGITSLTERIVRIKVI